MGKLSFLTYDSLSLVDKHRKSWDYGENDQKIKAKSDLVLSFFVVLYQKATLDVDFVKKI